MTNDEIKILSNMALVSSKIGIKDSYTEEDYFNLFQLIDGFKHLEKYFCNKDIINSILSKQIKSNELYKIIKLVRNRHAHIDKHNEVDKLVLLQTKVKREDIHKIIEEIRIEMDNIFKRDLNNDAYKLIMNTKIVANIFEMISLLLNEEETINEFDQYSKKILKPIWDSFDYENSSPEDFDKINEQIVNAYKSSEIKKGIIKLYGNQIYNNLFSMLTDNSFTIDQFVELMNRIKDLTKKEK